MCLLTTSSILPLLFLLLLCTVRVDVKWVHEVIAFCRDLIFVYCGIKCFYYFFVYLYILYWFAGLFSWLNSDDKCFLIALNKYTHWLIGCAQIYWRVKAWVVPGAITKPDHHSHWTYSCTFAWLFATKGKVFPSLLRIIERY